MRLELLTPPALVAVDDGGSARPALLLARRGDRRYVQVRRGPGSNHLLWVDAARLHAAPDAVPTSDAPTTSSAPAAGLPRALR